MVRSGLVLVSVPCGIKEEKKCGLEESNMSQSLINRLSAQLEQTQHELQRLQAHNQLTHDLNVITPFISQYYNDVFRAVKQEKPVLYARNWPELFSTASAEDVLFDEYEIDSKPVTDAVLRAMDTMGGLNEVDWQNLQKVRKCRNALGHPRGTLTMFREIVDRRWQHHPSLVKLSQYLQERFF